MPTPAELVSRIPPPFHTEKEKRRLERLAALDSIEKRLALLDKKASANSQSTSAATTVPTSFPTITTILRVITLEIVMPSRKKRTSHQL